ncbi:MAG: hypothetical protein MPN21_18600 [Thermoanaerobaculia bacterium]|nr:hypothetical protein [Thermoanaerobaculia bacterium]
MVDRVSVIAHSFGTFLIARTLQENPDIRIHRLILCGGIVPDDFGWEGVTAQLNTDRSGMVHVVNDCGLKDLLPVLAKSCSSAYGSSGHFGFGHPRVHDRFFPWGHGGFFLRRRIRKYWLPYLKEGRIEKGLSDQPTTPWWVSILTVLKLKFLVPLGLAASLFLIFFSFYYQPPIGSLVVQDVNSDARPGQFFYFSLDEIDRICNSSKWPLSRRGIPADLTRPLERQIEIRNERTRAKGTALFWNAKRAGQTEPGHGRWLENYVPNQWSKGDKITVFRSRPDCVP